MPFWRLKYHLVWATKNREFSIRSEVEDRLHGYIVAKAAELEVYVYAINSWLDHPHLVVSIPPKHAVACVVKRLKGASSRDVNRAGLMESQFSWQRGYAALSLGEGQRPRAEAYVADQKNHHRRQETVAWLERYAEFDEGTRDPGLSVDGRPAVVREAGVPYVGWGEPAF